MKNGVVIDRDLDMRKSPISLEEMRLKYRQQNKEFFEVRPSLLVRKYNWNGMLLLELYDSSITDSLNGRNRLAWLNLVGDIEYEVGCLILFSFSIFIDYKL